MSMIAHHDMRVCRRMERRPPRASSLIVSFSTDCIMLFIWRMVLEWDSRAVQNTSPAHSHQLHSSCKQFISCIEVVAESHVNWYVTRIVVSF